MDGHTLYTDEETGQSFWWKDCVVPGCENQVCLRLSDRFCWPHSMSGGGPLIKRREVEIEEFNCDS